MLPTPLILSMILSMPAFSAALPIAPEPRALRIVDDTAFAAHASLMRRTFGDDEEDEVPSDSLYSAAEEANADWDALRLARRARLALREAAAAAAAAPPPAKARKAKRSKTKKARRGLKTEADLTHIIAAAVVGGASAGPSTVTVTADTATATVVAYQLISAGATISPGLTTSASISLSTVIPAASPTSAPVNTGVARGPNAQATNSAVVSSLVSAWADDSVHKEFYAAVLKAEPTVAANGDAYDGANTTSTGWEIPGQHRAATLMYMEAGVGACGGRYSDEAPVVALSHAIFQSWPGATANINHSPLCGRRVQIEYDGVIVHARVADSHEGAQSDLVVTEGLFERFASLDQGILEDAMWSFI